MPEKAVETVDVSSSGSASQRIWPGELASYPPLKMPRGVAVKQRPRYRHPRDAVAMAAEAANLRQEIGRRPILREHDRGPRAGDVVTGENASGAGQIPCRGKQQRNWPRQSPSLNRPSRKPSPPEHRRRGRASRPLGEAFLKRMIDPPPTVRGVEHQISERPLVPLVPADLASSRCPRRACRHVRSAGAFPSRRQTARPHVALTRRVGHLRFGRAAPSHTDCNSDAGDRQCHRQARAQATWLRCRSPAGWTNLRNRAMTDSGVSRPVRRFRRSGRSRSASRTGRRRHRPRCGECCGRPPGPPRSLLWCGRARSRPARAPRRH